MGRFLLPANLCFIATRIQFGDVCFLVCEMHARVRFFSERRLGGRSESILDNRFSQETLFFVAEND